MACLLVVADPSDQLFHRDPLLVGELILLGRQAASIDQDVGVSCSSSGLSEVIALECLS